MKNFSILSVFLFSLCVSLSVHAEDDATAGTGAGDDLSERRLLLSKASSIHRPVGHPSVYGSASYFQAQPSQFGYLQPSFGFQQQYPPQPVQVPMPSMPSLPSFLQQQYQYQHPQQGFPAFPGFGGFNAFPGYVRNTVNRGYTPSVGCPSPTPAVSVGGYLKSKYTFPSSYGYGLPSADFGVIPNVLSGLPSGTSFRSNTGAEEIGVEEN